MGRTLGIIRHSLLNHWGMHVQIGRQRRRNSCKVCFRLSLHGSLRHTALNPRWPQHNSFEGNRRVINAGVGEDIARVMYKSVPRPVLYEHGRRVRRCRGNHRNACCPAVGLHPCNCSSNGFVRVITHVEHEAEYVGVFGGCGIGQLFESSRVIDRCCTL